MSKTTFLALCAAAAVGVGRLPAASAGARAEMRALRPADQELARRILADARMDKVRAMGLELLRSGLNAGSGYAEVWIRDLNTFLVPALEAAWEPWGERWPCLRGMNTFYVFRKEGKG